MPSKMPKRSCTFKIERRIFLAFLHLKFRYFNPCFSVSTDMDIAVSVSALFSDPGAYIYPLVAKIMPNKIVLLKDLVSLLFKNMFSVNK